MTVEEHAEDGARDRSSQQLRERLVALVEALRREQGERVPSAEPYYASNSVLKGGIKRSVVRAARPATRRYDRLAADLAEVAVELSERLVAAEARLTATEDHVRRLHGDTERLDRAIQSVRAQLPDEPERGGARVSDAYYWSFERRMRGSAESVVDRTRQYERLAVPLREAMEAGAGDAGSPLWLDLGCGTGEFCELLREWGWSVEGVDASPSAVEACRERGFDTTLADALEYLETRQDRAPAAISAIQLIEHLPRTDWIPLFEGAHRVLAPRGALLVETINGLNPEAVTAYFLADVTHSWPGHPETLRLMAEHAGFASVEVEYLNPDHRGNAQDFAVWARKA